VDLDRLYEMEENDIGALIRFSHQGRVCVDLTSRVYMATSNSLI
jgi:hypothetical protein